MSKLNTHELLIHDTMVELLDELREAPHETAFDKGYRQGMARALDVFKHQAKGFGIGDSVGLVNFEYGDWIR